jgi:hypothetical protein
MKQTQEVMQNHRTQQEPLAINAQYPFEPDQNAALLTPLRKQDSNEPSSGV